MFGILPRAGDLCHADRSRLADYRFGTTALTNVANWAKEIL